MSFDKMVELEQKCLNYLDTFVVNSGRTLAKQIILDTLKKDAVEEKMRDVRCTYLYEKGAREYYAKYGTHGEF